MKYQWVKTAAVIFSSFFLALFPEKAACLEWPVKTVRLYATFGENRMDRFHSGIDIGSGEQEVRPIADGEIVYAFEEKENPDALPSGLGSFIVIEHDKELRSLYAHLKKGSLVKGPGTVSQQDVIAVTGDSGNSSGKVLHLALIDRV